MRIFLSYSRTDAAIAEQITVNLKQAGHDVFFDKYGIEVAEDFNRVIWREIQKAALFIFLISPNSVNSGSYALTELALAEKKWPNPQWRVLGVVIEATDYAIIPVYASLCHILHPKGNLSSEVRDEVNALNSRRRIKRLLPITAITAGLVLAGSLLHAGYREFLAQRPLAARERLAAMNLFSAEAFVDSAFKGDPKLMELYLTAGMDPNAAKKDHATALMSAVQGNHIEIIKMLLAAGADVNTSRSLTHNTALDDAATTGQEAALRLLLEAGADSDTVDRAFVRAVAHKEMRCFYILLDHGVTQNAIDNAFVMAAVNNDHALLQTLSDRITDQSHTASEALLEIAGISKKKFRQIPEATRTETFKFLFARGADVDAWNENGFTPLGLAVSNQNLTLAQLLLAHNANIDMHSKCMGRVSGWTPLTLAISTKASAVGDDDLADASSMIRLLLASGADVNLAKLGCRNEKTRHDETPLMLAADGGDLQLARSLISKGAKVNIQDGRGFTALAYGASNRNMLAELLANNADIHVGNSPLVPAIEQKNYQAVENLLEAGANVNKKDSEGTTPLMLAVKVSSPDILMLLLSAGARTSDKDNMGRTAEMFATLKHADEMVALLRNAER